MIDSDRNLLSVTAWAIPRANGAFWQWAAPGEAAKRRGAGRWSESINTIKFDVYCSCEQIISAAPTGAAQRAREIAQAVTLRNFDRDFRDEKSKILRVKWII